MTENNSEFVAELWKPMKIPAQGIGNGLGFVVVEQARQVPPTFIVSQLDQPRAKFRPKKHPPQGEHRNDGRIRTGGSKKGSEETRLDQHGLPSECVKRLADIDD